MVRSWLSVLLSLPCVALDASASADVGQTWVQENGARRSPPFHQGGGIASLTIATEDQVATMSSTSPTSTVAPCGALEACLAHTNCSRCFTAIRPFLGQAVETLAQDHLQVSVFFLVANLNVPCAVVVIRWPSVPTWSQHGHLHLVPLGGVVSADGLSCTLQREFYTTLIRTPLCGLNSTPETLLFPALDVLSRRPNGEKPLPCSQKFGLTIGAYHRTYDGPPQHSHSDCGCCRFMSDVRIRVLLYQPQLPRVSLDAVRCRPPQPQRTEVLRPTMSPSGSRRDPGPVEHYHQRVRELRRVPAVQLGQGEVLQLARVPWVLGRRDPWRHSVAQGQLLGLQRAAKSL